MSGQLDPHEMLRVGPAPATVLIKPGAAVFSRTFVVKRCQLVSVLRSAPIVTFSPTETFALSLQHSPL